MARSKVLTEFKGGAVTGCHCSKKSAFDISSLLDIPRSTVSAIITKGKLLGATAMTHGVTAHLKLHYQVAKW